MRRTAKQRTPLTRRTKASPSPRWPRTAVYWRDDTPAERVVSGRAVVIEDSRPFVLHFGRDGWSEIADRLSIRLRNGAHGVRLDSIDLLGARELNFTRFYPGDDRWEGVDHVVGVQAGSDEPLAT